MVQKKAFLNIYVSAYPFECGSQNISFASRAEEIEACTNENVRRQKFYVWKLLELAVNDLPGMDLNSLNLRKDENGKWQSDKIYISLSHSGNVVAAAVSDSSVGLDIEFFNEKKFGKSLANRIATESEKSFFAKERAFSERVCALWTRKESEFKRKGEKIFRPFFTDALSSPCRTFLLKCNHESYVLSVSGESVSKSSFVTPFDNVVVIEEIK